MKVRILKSFSAHGAHEGAVIDMPKDADWVEAGLAEPVEKEKTPKTKTKKTK